MDGERKGTPPPNTSGWVDYPGTWDEFQARSQMDGAKRDEEIAGRKRELQGLEIVDWETLEQSPKKRDALAEQIAVIFQRDIQSDELTELMRRLKEKEERVMAEFESTGKFDQSELSLPSQQLVRLMHPICLELQIRMEYSTYSKLAKAALNLIASHEHAHD